MGSDFTIIIRNFEQFGDEPGNPYWGPTIRGDSHEYTFDCPGIDTSQTAVWFHRSQGAKYSNRVTLNGSTGNAVGWIGKSSSDHMETHIDMIDEGILMKTGNVLRIEAVNKSGQTRSEGGAGNLDDFVIGELVVFYKTSRASGGRQTAKHS